ncbi:hypothetical protein CDAR_497201 [Caerostris darwini]|uniref:Uncharacterized protein n=1 Tax=Caerostris darwini TaxID=1538125 RepID=A0AAV4S494_9ARAC|nr:hypothetical protein CDAR_497201 [Caerostris darwini]
MEMGSDNETSAGPISSGHSRGQCPQGGGEQRNHVPSIQPLELCIGMIFSMTSLMKSKKGWKSMGCHLPSKGLCTKRRLLQVQDQFKTEKKNVVTYFIFSKNSLDVRPCSMGWGDHSVKKNASFEYRLMSHPKQVSKPHVHRQSHMRQMNGLPKYPADECPSLSQGHLHNGSCG